MCDSEWKDRLGFKMNYSSGEEETDRYFLTFFSFLMEMSKLLFREKFIFKIKFFLIQMQNNNKKKFAKQKKIKKNKKILKDDANFGKIYFFKLYFLK